VLSKLTYLTLCSAAHPARRGDAAKDLEILVLRHQLIVLGTGALSPTASAKPGAVEALPTRRHQETTWNTRSCPQSALLGG
jgi:hypothetical protein